MTAFRDWACAATIASVTLAGLAEARAQMNGGDADPSVWLRKVYDLYPRAESSLSPETQPSTDLVEKRPRNRSRRCSRGTRLASPRGKGTCALDWDFVREEGRWRVDDIETQTGKDAPIRISKMLKDYDDSQGGRPGGGGVHRRFHIDLAALPRV